MIIASLLDGFLIIGGGVLFWRLIGKPLIGWADFQSFQGLKVVPRRDPEHPCAEVDGEEYFLAPDGAWKRRP